MGANFPVLPGATTQDPAAANSSCRAASRWKWWRRFGQGSISASSRNRAAASRWSRGGRARCCIWRTSPRCSGTPKCPVAAWLGSNAAECQPLAASLVKLNRPSVETACCATSPSCWGPPARARAGAFLQDAELVGANAGAGDIGSVAPQGTGAEGELAWSTLLHCPTGGRHQMIVK